MENIIKAIAKLFPQSTLAGVDITQEKGLTIIDAKYNPREVWNEKALVTSMCDKACEVYEVLLKHPK